MVEQIGHVAIALLFALPAWIFWDGRTGGVFVVFVLATASIPDLDLWVRDYVSFVEHHGVMHTVVFVVSIAIVAGIVAVAVATPTLKRWWRLTEDERVDKSTVQLFVTSAFALGGLSHLVGDVLADDAYQKVEPFWPVVRTEVHVGIGHYTSPWLNGFLLVVAVALHAAVLLSGQFPLEHRFRRMRAELSG